MHPLKTSTDLDALLQDIDNASVVMLGEASHGTHEYYTWRTAITKRLIQEKGFRFIAVEGDWPDCYKINRWVKGYADPGNSIDEVLKTFDRWPTWMWGNWEIAALAEWLRAYNSNLPMQERVGFYGLDVYSLWDSMKMMMEYLQKEDPVAATQVKRALRCFEPFNEDEQEYARFTLSNYGCRDELTKLLQQIRKIAQYDDGDSEAVFNTEQNALIAVNAEKYYRAMMEFDNESWNIRDRHMMETLNRLLQFHGTEPKAIVWEHNTHIGDARATDMAGAGMVNIGQLAREQYGKKHVYLAGFASYEGTVVAGESWGDEMKIMQVPHARDGSIEAILHADGMGNRYILLSKEKDELYDRPIPHRAIGVVYHPYRERWGNYVPSVLAKRYDALLFLDKTTALHALDLYADKHKLAETFPWTV